MTLASATNRVSYAGNDSYGPFTYTFRIQDDDDLLVTKRVGDVETTLTKTTNYTVAGVGNAQGTITLVGLRLNVGETLVIRRRIPLTQSTSLRNLGAFFPATHEDALDRLVMGLQQLDHDAGRSLRMQETLDVSALNMRVPTFVASKALAVKSNGTELEWVTIPDIAAAAAVQGVVPGTVGSVLVSDGANWQRTTTPTLVDVRVSRFGINKAVDAAVSIDLDRTVNTAVTEYGLRINLVQQGAGIGYGIQNRVDHSGSISAAAFDQRIRTLSGNRDHIVGFQNVSQHSSTGSLTWLYGYYNSFIVSDGCAVTNAANFYIVAPQLLAAAGVQVTNLYGIYIEDQFHARATNKYAIYQAGAARSHFDGSVDVQSLYTNSDVGIGVAFGGEVSLGANVRTVDIRGSVGGGVRFGVGAGATGFVIATATYMELGTSTALPIRFTNTVNPLAEFTATGSFVMGTGALATTATDGFLYIAACAGTPTGVPTAHAGRVPMVYDTTNDEFYIYRGGWKSGAAFT